MCCFDCKYSYEYNGEIKRTDGKKEMYCSKKDFTIGTIEQSKKYVYIFCYEKK
jgi:hypothetical protein